MTNIAEMDRSRWIGFSEPNLGAFNPGDSRDIGDTMSDGVMTSMRKHGIVLPRDGRYLGIAAGQAYAELEFARKFRVRPDRITFVDREFGQGIRARVEATKPGVHLEESGLFDYLHKSPNEQFALITALGIEYVLCNSELMDYFTTQVARVLQKPGVAAVFPHYGDRPTHRRLEQIGLREIHGLRETHTLLAYAKI